MNFSQLLFPNKEIIIFFLVIPSTIFSIILLIIIKNLKRSIQKMKLKELKFQSLYENNLDPIIIFDSKGEILKTNQKALDCSNNDLIHWLQESITSTVAGRGQGQRKQYFLRAINGEAIMFTSTFRNKNGKELFLLIKNIPIKLEGKSEGCFTIILDLTEQKATEKKLFETTERLKSFLNVSNYAIDITTADSKIIYANPAFESMFGWQEEEIKGKEIPIHISEDEQEREKVQTILENKGGISNYETRLKRKDGNLIDVSITLSPIVDEMGNLKEIAAITRDISERKHYENQLKQFAYYDSLTNIPNRRLFYDPLSQTIKKAKQSNSNFALFYLNCDCFKSVNDTHGHDIGDKLLQWFVQRVKDCIGESDTIARLGGDEFAIILDRYDSPQEIARVAFQIIHSLQNPWKIDEREFVITSSIGIALFPDDGTHLNTLMDHADKALYLSKEKGRNMYHFYTEEVAAKTKATILLEDDLKRAISSKRFHLVYQPQFDIKRKKMVGVEVLLRYSHPVLGAFSPEKFIPLCEKLGIMDEVTEWVINEAFKQQKDWEMNGLGEIHLAINISPSTLEKNSFIPMVNYYLNKFKTNPTTIEFEITEDALLHNMESICLILDNLKNLGIRISLDDFGAGFTSLKYLKDLPIDKLKIDRSFVKGIPFREKEKAIVESIISLSHKLKIEVLSEGVETIEQLNFLRNKGCKLIQGYYFSKPLLKTELESKWIHSYSTYKV